jgi:WD40 repeat protein
MEVDNKELFSASADRLAIRWNLRTGEPLTVYSGHTSEVGLGPCAGQCVLCVLPVPVGSGLYLFSNYCDGFAYVLISCRRSCRWQ